MPKINPEFDPNEMLPPIEDSPPIENGNLQGAINKPRPQTQSFPPTPQAKLEARLSARQLRKQIAEKNRRTRRNFLVTALGSVAGIGGAYYMFGSNTSHKETSPDDLKQPLQSPPKYVQESPPDTWIREYEKTKWHEVLGINVDIKPFPKELTPQALEKIAKYNLKLRYFPKLNFDKALFQSGMTESFLRKIELNHPSWRRFEGLTPDEATNLTIPRNIKKSFWDWVAVGSIEFPNLPGQWAAVEVFQKPAENGKYPELTLSQIDNNHGRFGRSWDEITLSLKRKQPQLLHELGLAQSSENQLRLLNALEWNLIANREKWRPTPTGEWTNTAVAPENAILMGYSGDPSNYASFGKMVRMNHVGYRFGFFLPP